MAGYHPLQIIAYHSCDRETGIKVLNGKDLLIPSNNSWDWLGKGIYFWEQDPKRALDYGVEVASGNQKNRRKIINPFVLGAVIELGNCLNLVESRSLQLLEEAYKGLIKAHAKSGESLPVNFRNQRKLDCAVIQFIHQSTKDDGQPHHDTVRSAFYEGTEIYPSANFSTKNHIQVCVINSDVIKGYFMPYPIYEFNPYLTKEFVAASIRQ